MGEKTRKILKNLLTLILALRILPTHSLSETPFNPLNELEIFVLLTLKLNAVNAVS